MKPRTIIIVVVIGLALLGSSYWAYQSINLMPVEAADRAVQVDQLFRVMLGVATFIFLLVEGALLYSVLRFRRRPGDDGDGLPVHNNRWLEVVWTVIPVIIVLVIGIYSFRVLTDIEAAGPDSIVVNVHSRQFSWSFDYPAFGVASSDLHLPVGRRVRFLITSDDVIHSFWIPEFRAKRDATPGEISQLVITPTLIGSYPIRCAELCGSGHASMGLSSQAVVESQADFDAWIAQQRSQSNDPVALFKQFGCIGCSHANVGRGGRQGRAGPGRDRAAGGDASPRARRRRLHQGLDPEPGRVRGPRLPRQRYATRPWLADHPRTAFDPGGLPAQTVSGKAQAIGDRSHDR